MELTLHLIDDKGDDSDWAIIHYGPICYLTCSEVIAKAIVNLLNVAKAAGNPEYEGNPNFKWVGSDLVT